MALRVLVADDSLTIQKVVKLAFAGEDVVIESVSDGNAAMESLSNFGPDIVLADVFMPGLKGYEVCERIKNNPEMQHIPVILLVGTFEPFDQTEAARVRCSGFLTKPFDTAELIQMVRMHAGDKVSLTIPAEGEGSAKPVAPKLGSLASPAAMKSFLGSGKFLEVFDLEVATGKPAANAACLSEEALATIVDRVVRKMSAEVIREVAWEVVPELSDAILRQTIKEQKSNR